AHIDRDRWYGAGIQVQARCNRAENNSKRAKHDDKVYPRPLVLYVVEVLVHVAMEWRPISMMDLPPARNAGPNTVAFQLPWLIKTDELRLLRPGSDQCHFTPNDVP